MTTTHETEDEALSELAQEKGWAMVAEIFGGLSALKTAFDMTQALQNIHDTVARDRAVIELQKEILSAQAAQSTLIDRVRELEKEVADFEAWEVEKKRYRLTDFGGGTFAYALKPDEAKGEPAHRVCAHCYQDGHIAILQCSHRSDGQDYFDCLRCKARQAFGVYRSTADYAGIDDEGG